MQIFFRDDIEVKQREALARLAVEIGWDVVEEATPGAHIVSHDSSIDGALSPDWIVRRAFLDHGMESDEELIAEASKEDLMKGWVVFVDEACVPETDADLMLAGVAFFGGRPSFHLRDPFLTHIVTLTDSRYEALVSERSQPALSPELRKQLREVGLLRDPVFVLPHFLDDCFKLKRPLPFDDYAFPKPPILQLDYPAEPQHVHEPSRVLAPPAPSQPFLSSNHIFFFDPVYPMPDDVINTYKFSLSKAGVCWSNDYNTATAIVVAFQESPFFSKAVSDGKMCGTIYWLLDILQTCSLTNPKRKLLCFPWPRLPIRGTQKMVMTISNYTRAAREMLKMMIIRLGASYSRDLTPFVTHVVCASAVGAKYEKALEWSIPIVNHTWLEDCWLNQKVMSVTEPGYTILRGQLCRVVGQVEFNPNDVLANIDAAIDNNKAIELNAREMNLFQRELGRVDDMNLDILEKREEPKVKRKLSIENIHNENIHDEKRVRRSMPNRLPSHSDAFSSQRRPQILFTHVKFSHKELNILKTLGIREAESPKDCTHLISDKVARTEKFLCALAYADYVLSPKWIYDCIKKHRHVPELPYALKDKPPHPADNTSITEISLLAKQRKLLEGYTVIATSSIDPRPNILQNIVDCHNGKFLSHEMVTKRRLKGAGKVIVVSSTEDEHEWNILCFGKHKHI